MPTSRRARRRRRRPAPRRRRRRRGRVTAPRSARPRRRCRGRASPRPRAGRDRTPAAGPAAPGVVEPRVVGEVGMQTLGERWEALRSLRPVVERGRAGDHEIEAGEATAVDLVDELAQRVEPLLAHVAANALQRLDLVEHEHQARMPAVAQHDEQTLQEARARRSGRSRPCTPAARLTAAGTLGWPPSQARMPSASASSPCASAPR